MWNLWNWWMNEMRAKWMNVWVEETNVRKYPFTEIYRPKDEPFALHKFIFIYSYSPLSSLLSLLSHSLSPQYDYYHSFGSRAYFSKPNNVKQTNGMKWSGRPVAIQSVTVVRFREACIHRRCYQCRDVRRCRSRAKPTSIRNSTKNFNKQISISDSRFSSLFLRFMTTNIYSLQMW